MLSTRTVLLAFVLVSIGQCCSADYGYSVTYIPSAPGTKMILQGVPRDWGVHTDGYDGEHDLTLPFPSNPVHIALYKTQGVDSWDGASGFYIDDLRQALLPGQTALFNDIYLWVEPGTPSHDIVLGLVASDIDPGVTYRLSLVSLPTGVTYTGRTEWEVDDRYVTLPFYSTDDGRTGYRFRAEFTAIPEPSSLTALASALCGAGGLALRRRRG